ncbi:MAG: putative toxin-antitoxin system toxin component, PIN family [Chloroflexota bacterium]
MQRVVLFDANVVVSMLIASQKPSSVMNSLVELALAGAYLPVVTASTQAEVRHTIERNPNLRRRISNKAIEELFVLLAAGVGRCLPPRNPLTRICRDPRDDYLIEEARVCGATHLVTGDLDLLVLDGAFPFRIMTPRQFADDSGWAV